MSVNQVKTDGSLQRIAGGTLYADSPIGTIVPYGGTSAPSGYLLCNGAAVSRTTYAELYAVIGTAFGTGDGSTTFNLPDLREATTKGVGLTGLSTNHYDSDGVALGEFIEDRVQSHTHTDRYATSSKSNIRWTGTPDFSVVTSVSNASSQGGNNSDRNGATTEVKAVGVNYIIKALQTSLPVDLDAAVEEKVADGFNYQSGNISIPSTSAQQGDDIVVTFASPMADTNYVINTETYTPWLPCGVSSKNVNGFTLTYRNSQATASINGGTIKWQAYRIPQ